MLTAPAPVGRPGHRFFIGVVGAILVGFGSYVLFAVLMKLRDFIDTPESMKIFLTLVPEDPALRTMTIDAQTVVLPLIVFHYTAFFLCLLLLFLAAAIGGRLLINGINLLTP